MSNNGSKWIRPEKRARVYARDSFRCSPLDAGEASKRSKGDVMSKNQNKSVPQSKKTEEPKKSAAELKVVEEPKEPEAPAAAPVETQKKRDSRPAREKTAGNLARTRGVLAKITSRVQAWASNNPNPDLADSSKRLTAGLAEITAAYDSFMKLPINIVLRRVAGTGTPRAVTIMVGSKVVLRTGFVKLYLEMMPEESGANTEMIVSKIISSGKRIVCTIPGVGPFAFPTNHVKESESEPAL